MSDLKYFKKFFKKITKTQQLSQGLNKNPGQLVKLKKHQHHGMTAIFVLFMLNAVAKAMPLPEVDSHKTVIFLTPNSGKAD